MHHNIFMVTDTSKCSSHIYLPSSLKSPIHNISVTPERTMALTDQTSTLLFRNTVVHAHGMQNKNVYTSFLYTDGTSETATLFLLSSPKVVKEKHGVTSALKELTKTPRCEHSSPKHLLVQTPVVTDGVKLSFKYMRHCMGYRLRHQ